MKEFLVKVNGKYELKLLDVCEHPDAVEVPSGADCLTLCNNVLIYWKGQDYSFDIRNDKGWVHYSDDSMKLDYYLDFFEGSGVSVVWKRKPNQEVIDNVKHSHYKKDVKKLDTIDVYRVLELFEVKSHAVGHAVKKLLCSGERGAKDYKQDIQEAIDSLQRHLEMLEEDER